MIRIREDKELYTREEWQHLTRERDRLARELNDDLEFRYNQMHEQSGPLSHTEQLEFSWIEARLAEIEKLYGEGAG